MATITKKIGFENLLSNPSMNKDSNADGVVDGWTKFVDGNASAEWFLDSAEQAQMMNVLSATATAFPGIENSSFIPVTANAQYTFSAYLKSEGNISGGASGTGPRLEIAWYTSGQVYISNVVGNIQMATTFTRDSVSGIAPSNAAYAKVRVIFRCNDTSAYGTVWVNKAQFERGQNLVVNPAMTVDTNTDNVADGFSTYSSGTISATRTIDMTENAQKIDATSSGSAGAWASVYQEISATAGKAYSFGVDIKTGTGTVEARFYISWYNDSGALNQFSPFTNVSPNTGWQRYTISNQIAPAGTTKARLYFQVYCRNGGETGAVWFKNAKFEQNATATAYGVSNPGDFGEVDFFTLVDLAPTYTKGWAKNTAYIETGAFGYTSETVAAGSNTWSGAQIKYTVPVNADQITIKFWADTSRVTSADQLNIFCNGVSILTINGGTAGQTYTVSGVPAIRRGYQAITLQHTRTGSSNGNSVTIDNFEVSWTEVLPTPISLPLADVVKYLDFESDTYDSFFTITDKAPGYTYGFKITERKSVSGFYSYGVEDVDTDGTGIDEAGRAPTIPDSTSAGASIKFSVPVTAKNPKLKFKAMHDAEDNNDVGTYKLNGETIWVGKSGSVWEDVEVELSPGTDYELLLDYTKNASTYTDTDSVYIDDVIVYYNIPRKPYMLIATAPETVIKTGTVVTTTYTENFEDSYFDKFFTVNNPVKIGGIPGWNRTTKKAYLGTYSMRAITSSSIDFTFKVPLGVSNPKIEWWNYVSMKRARYAAQGDLYPRLYDQYKILVNGFSWKQFAFCSPDKLTASAYLGGGKGWACPWGRWWKETVNLTPGKTYTFTFNMQKGTGSGSTIDGEDLCCIDELKVSWTETPGDILTTPPQPLVYLDGRDGVAAFLPQEGVEAPPLSFSEYEVYGQRGSTYQSTNVEPRPVEFPIRIQAANSRDAQKKIQEITSTIIGKPLTLIYQYPEGEQRQLFCRYAGGLERERSRGNTFNGYRKRNLSFRAFDPMWYGNRVVIDGAYAESKTFLKLENTGDAEVWPIIKIYGPGVNPRVKLTDPDNTQTFISFKLVYTLNASRYILVDTRPGQKLILLDDGTSLYQYLDATDNQLFAIPQGKYAVSVTFDSGTDANTKLMMEYQLPYWGY